MNTVSINTVNSRLAQGVAKTLVVLAATLFVSTLAGQSSPAPSPIPWPPPNGAVKDKVTSTIAQLIRDAVKTEELRKKIGSCGGAKDEVQNRLGTSLPLPNELVIVFYEQKGPLTTGDLSYAKNTLYSIFYLPPTAAEMPSSDIEVFRKYLICCYQPW